MERESSKNTKTPLCEQTKTFRYEIVFREILPCFLHSRSERLACFKPTELARFLKKLRYVMHSIVKETTFLKGNIFIY